MTTVKKNGNQDRGPRREDQAALARPVQGQLVRDPFQALMRDPFQLMREMMLDPFRAMQRMSAWSDLERRGGDGAWMPGFEIRETDSAFVFKADLPGVRHEDLDISLHGNNLQICGKREREHETDEGTLHGYERSFGQFARSFVLPETADVDKLSCELKDGVLSLVVPKKEGAPQRRKIEIGTGAKQ